MTTPFERNSYRWPRVGVSDEDGVTELNVHRLRDSRTGQHKFVGFVGVDREEQIDQVLHLAHQVGAVVEPLDGSGFTDDLINILMMACATGIGARASVRCDPASFRIER
jgi:hypothetical protein